MIWLPGKLSAVLVPRSRWSSSGVIGGEGLECWKDWVKTSHNRLPIPEKTAVGRHFWAKELQLGHVLSLGVGLRPSAEMLWPKYSTDICRKKHFDRFSFSPASPSLVSTSSSVWRCSCSDAPVTKMSSILTQTLSMPRKMPSMVRWNIDGAEATPNGSRLYRKRPLWVLITVYRFDSSSRGICW